VKIDRRGFAKLGAALAASLVAPVARAQDAAHAYPTKPIRMIIPFAPGAGTDATGRLVGQKMSEALGQAVVVENRDGAGGSIGLGVGAKAAPDGYTITLLTSSHTVNVTLQGGKQPYDLGKDFAPITELVTQPYVLVINPKLPVTTIKELLAYGKQRAATPLTYASAGPGSTGHLSGALLSQMSGVPLTHIPFRGAGPAFVGVMSGDVDMLFATRIGAEPLVKAGKLRALAQTGLKRSKTAPDLPTIDESGVPGYQAASWYGLTAPAGTPPAVIDKLNKTIVHILQQPDVVQRLNAEGSEPVGNTPQEFADYIQSEIARFRKLIKDAGIPVQSG
jgi:tripartite-type tricarboxylate transporter receptor subunit TctC